MNYNALKHYLKKINSHLPKNLRGVFNDTTEIRLFHNGHFVFTLPGLAMLESLNIKKQENGLWHVYCSERNSISDLSIFNDEDRACDYFISELHTFWPLSTFKGAVIYPALVINGIIIRDEATIDKFWNLYVGSNNEHIENIWDRHSGLKIGRKS